MHPQASKRHRQMGRTNRGSSYSLERPILSSELGYLYRRVDDTSAETFSRATREVNKWATPIGVNFAMTLAYSQKLRKLLERSSAPYRPDMATLAAKLSMTPTESMRQTVTASLENIETFGNVVGVCVSYPGYEEEQAAMAAEVSDLLGYPASYRLNIGPGMPHIGIVLGSLAFTQMKQMRAQLPDIVELGPARNTDGPI